MSKKKVKTRSLSELVDEMEAEHPGLKRRIRLEVVWFDIEELLDDYPDLSPTEAAPLYRAAALSARVGTIASGAIDGNDEVTLRRNLLSLAARAVHWVEQIDAKGKP